MNKVIYYCYPGHYNGIYVPETKTTYYVHCMNEHLWRGMSKLYTYLHKRDDKTWIVNDRVVTEDEFKTPDLALADWQSDADQEAWDKFHLGFVPPAVDYAIGCHIAYFESIRGYIDSSSYVLSPEAEDFQLEYIDIELNKDGEFKIESTAFKRMYLDYSDIKDRPYRSNKSLYSNVDCLYYFPT